jgi:hypothetical protein
MAGLEMPNSAAKQLSPQEAIYDPPSDVVQRLYKALYDHTKFCNCDIKTRSKGRTRIYHAARLSMRPETVVPKKGLTQFDVSFSRFLEPCEDQTETYWQHLRLYVPNSIVSSVPKGGTKLPTRHLHWGSESTTKMGVSISTPKGRAGVMTRGRESRSSTPKGRRGPTTPFKSGRPSTPMKMGVSFSSLEVRAGPTIPVTESRSSTPKSSLGAMSRLKSSRPSTTEIRDSVVSEAIPTNESEAVLRADEFCDLLQRDVDEVRLCLRVEADALIQLCDAEMVEPSVGATRSYPLAEVLGSERLSTKTRLTLAYSVARSVWLYYNSDWMKKLWSSNSIHLMPESDSNLDEPLRPQKPNTSNPCLAFQFDDSEDDCEEIHRLKTTIHKHPRLRALGNLLLELAHKHPRQIAPLDPSNSRDPDAEVKAINRECIQAFKTFNDKSWPDFNIRDKENIQIYTDAVKSCFEHKTFSEQAMFDAMPRNDEQYKAVLNKEGIGNLPKDLQVELRRKILYQKVLAPLEGLLKNAEIVESTVNHEEIKTTAATTSASTATTIVKQGRSPSECVDITSLLLLALSDLVPLKPSLLTYLT